MIIAWAEAIAFRSFGSFVKILDMRILLHTMHDQPRDPADDEVHLWSAALDCSCDDSVLTDCEMARSARYKIDHVRRQFICARAHLRIILGRYLGLDPRAVGLALEQSGKPILDPKIGSDLKFNVSHSESLAVYAVTRRGRVGVDVEQPRLMPNIGELVERFFRERERRAFFALPESDRPAAFFCAWTRKEAVLKAVGLGVQAVDQCDVTFCPGEPEAVLQLGDDAKSSGKWFLRSWQPRDDYVAAVAVELKPAS
jgi:4'-phosphopantetheinyl transferase